MKINSKNEFFCLLAIVTVSLGLILGVNSVLVNRSETRLIETEGQMRLSSIAGQVNSSLYRSECLLDSLVMQVSQILADGGDVKKDLDNYFSQNTVDSFMDKSGGNCFSAYAAYDGKLYINDFIPDESFILDERSWYVGAKKTHGRDICHRPLYRRKYRKALLQRIKNTARRRDCCGS